MVFLFAEPQITDQNGDLILESTIRLAESSEFSGPSVKYISLSALAVSGIGICVLTEAHLPATR